MTDPAPPSNGAKTLAWGIGSLGTVLLVALLAWTLWRYARPDPLGADRVRERYTFLQEVQEAEALTLTAYGWVDKEKGVIRLPLDRALELTLAEWQDPVAARAQLIARVEKATELPPPPPEPENPYE